MTCTFIPCLSCLPEQKGRSAANRSLGNNSGPSRITNALAEAAVPAVARPGARHTASSPMASVRHPVHRAHARLEPGRELRAGAAPGRRCASTSSAWRPADRRRHRVPRAARYAADRPVTNRRCRVYKIEGSRIDKHMKPPAAPVTSVVNPSTRSITACAGQPAGSSTTLALDTTATGSA